ncbi:MAG: type IV secretion system protein [Rhodanobacter sp.]|jgi:type IV secretion system protein VirB8
MARTAKPGSATERSIAQSTRFELTIAELARRSERRAWRVAWCAVALALATTGGYYFMLPLKQKIPYLVMADAYTGTATVARLDGDFAMRGITTREAVNRSNVAHFVLARESYDLDLVNLRDWKTVQTMASAGVKAPYVQLYANSNPDNLIRQFGKDQAIRIKLLSIQLIGGGPGKTPRGATVRFQRSLYNKQNGATRPLDNKIATIAFTYKQNLEMDDQSRVENPLGFWVTSYRVDDDYATAPPPEVSVVPPAMTQPAPAMARAPAPASAAPVAAATDTLSGAGSR